ncbi:hypothetical protein P8891_13500 [Bacillus atrophaeus]|nr:hypothetical protein [Bacillus atrophaeus]MCY7947345.1 hypothetical protein [Bacillus atrophaeus]MCY8098365.1 hypothetical protein [Bacillus atrophaeus]MCY8916255.1 hypothetical protein [Bacillus atrophaeus]MCY8926413.1 hypothetical protein [Bacillus atrophaeus]MCY9168109.1 hypothetical protein [Bacillus atrophaeus]
MKKRKILGISLFFFGFEMSLTAQCKREAVNRDAEQRGHHWKDYLKGAKA